MRGARSLATALLVLAVAWEASVALYARPLRWAVPSGSYSLASAAAVLFAWPLRAQRQSLQRLLVSYTVALTLTGASGLVGWHAFDLGAIAWRALTYLLLPWLWLAAQVKP